MGVPKNFRNNINVNRIPEGVELRGNMVKNIANKGTFLPKGILEADMDRGFINFVKDNMCPTIDGQKVISSFYTLQKFQEFTQNWLNTDKYRNQKLPFISIVRRPDIQQGTNHIGYWNIPGFKTYTYYKVATKRGDKEGVDLYKIPQPVAVDLTYEVKFYTDKMKHLNEINTLVSKLFSSRQFYIYINEHPIPLVCDGIGDESNLSDLNSRRYYVVTYEIKMLGYLLDPKDFVVKPMIDTLQLDIDVIDYSKVDTGVLSVVEESKSVTYNFIFKEKVSTEFYFINQYDSIFTQLLNIVNISRITIWCNNLIVFDGITMVDKLTFSTNDNIRIKIYKNDNNVSGTFHLVGYTI